MYAVSEFVTGLIVIHVAWLYFFLCGSLLRVRSVDADAAPPPHAQAVLEIIVSTASGIAITGLATFFLGLLGLLYPLTFAGLVAAVGVAFVLLGDSPLRRSFWTRRLAVWRAAARPGTAILYAAALTLSAAAILPDGGSDATAYYYAYAFDWAGAHRIYADDWLRLPYYADNWILLYTWMYELGLERFTQFLPWLTGALSLFGIYGCVLVLPPHAQAEGPGLRLVRHVTAVVAPATLLLSPVFLHWVDIGMVDVPLGLFFFVTVICMILIVKRSGRPYLRDLIVCGAFMIGMKSSFLAFLPLMAASIVLASQLSKISLRRTAGAVAILVALSSPWYVRNFILAGDPIAPVLNLKLHGVDKLDTVEDLALVERDLNGDHSLPALLRLPLDIVTKTPTRYFREPGVTWLLLLLGLPGAIVAFAALTRRRDEGLAIYVASAFIVYAVGYWILTSYLARYSLVFYPALAAVVGSLAVMVAARAGAFRWAAPLLVAALALPSPGSGSWLVAHWAETNATEWWVYEGRERWLARSPEVAAIRYTGRALRAKGVEHVNVYRLHLESYSLFFKEEGLVPIGDWVGPERYRDFVTAVEAGKLRSFLDRLGIGAILVQTPQDSLHILGTGGDWTSDDQRLLDEEAAQLHLIREPIPGGHYVLYFPS
jgi:hypothetical protein